jgi:hypothetical protein
LLFFPLFHGFSSTDTRALFCRKEESLRRTVARKLFHGEKAQGGIRDGFSGPRVALILASQLSPLAEANIFDAVIAFQRSKNSFGPSDKTVFT